MVVCEDGRYLLVRESKASARGRWALPAGKLEPDETLPAAAERECLEETGLVVRAERLVGVYHCPRTSEGFAVVNFVFAATIVGGTVAASPAHPEVGFLARDEVAELGRRRLLRGTHVEPALDAFAAGAAQPPVAVVAASPFP